MMTCRVEHSLRFINTFLLPGIGSEGDGYSYPHNPHIDGPQPPESHTVRARQFNIYQSYIEDIQG